jgi:hypothetical protein
VIDPAAVAQTLKQLMARTDVTATHAFVAASDAVATFRILHLPITATDRDVEAAVARELTLDPETTATRWVDVPSTNASRLVYAAAWDRALVKKMTDALKMAGVEPVVVELRSASVARAVEEPACIVIDMTSNPVELVLIDAKMPQLWHSFELPAGGGDDLAAALAVPLRSVLRFYRRRAEADFRTTAPIFISGDQAVPAQALTALAEIMQQPVSALPPPPRTPPQVRHATYLACLGLIMRRNG